MYFLFRSDKKISTLFSDLPVESSISPRILVSPLFYFRTSKLPPFSTHTRTFLILSSMTNFSKFCPLFNTHKPSIYKAISLPISLFQPLSHLHEKTMATFSYPYYFIRASSNRDSHDQNKQKLNNIRINGTSSMSSMKPDTLSQPAGVAST